MKEQNRKEILINDSLKKNYINNDKLISNSTLLNVLFITVNDNSIIYGGKRFKKQKYQGKITRQTKIYYRCKIIEKVNI